jgi:hypothetical protein
MRGINENEKMWPKEIIVRIPRIELGAYSSARELTCPYETVALPLS